MFDDLTRLNWVELDSTDLNWTRRSRTPELELFVDSAYLVPGWFAACDSTELGSTPIARTICGMPVVLFRSAETVTALLDRCPHRHVPLSLGTMVEGTLQCAYHGWRFNNEGRCTKVPGLTTLPSGEAIHCQAFKTMEQDGMVWIALQSVVGLPPRLRFADDPQHVTIRHQCTLPGPILDAAENALDVPHTRFLHGGLFRTAQSRTTIEVKVKRYHDRVEAEFFGEPRPTGLVAKFLAMGDGVVRHIDRFIMPGLIEVEYWMGQAHFIASAAVTPISQFETRLCAAVSVKSRIPASVLRAAKPLGLKVLAQDAAILAKQTQSAKLWDAAAYASTEIDALGPSIRKLYRIWQEGVPSKADQPAERSFSMEV